MLVFSLLWILNSSFNDSSLLLPLLCAWTCWSSARYQGALSWSSTGSFCLHAASWEVEEAYSIFWWIVISKVGSMLISASWLPFARVCHFFPFLAICKSKSTVWELMFCLCCLSHWWCAGAWFLEELFFALLLHCAVTIIQEIAFFRNCVGCFAPGCDWAISDLWQQVTRKQGKQGNGLSTFYFPFPPIIGAK